MTGVPPMPRALARGKSPQGLRGVHAPGKRWPFADRQGPSLSDGRPERETIP